MNNNEKYFVSLIASYLNNEAPALPENIDWAEIYRLAKINNTSAITANQIIRLDKKYQPEGELLSDFKQQIGYTLIDFEEKEKAVDAVKVFLNSLKIDRIFVKGEIIKNYYPDKELRTSADTDIIIRDRDLTRLHNVLNGHGFGIYDVKAVGFSVKVYNQSIEFHSNLDYDNKYFKNIFDFASCSGNEYVIDDYNHLLYVMCHIIKHFRFCGAGIKMFMDIDVFIRHIGNFDYDRFIGMCKELGIDTFSKAALSLCNYLFKTPVRAEFDFEKDYELRQLFENEIINGGSFGFSKRDLGSYYKVASSKNGNVSRIKAFSALFFPDSEYLKNQFGYAKKHSALLPAAWLNRIILAVFKNGRHSVNTINSIAKSSSDSSYIKLLKELEISDKNL